MEQRRADGGKVAGALARARAVAREVATHIREIRALVDHLPRMDSKTAYLPDLHRKVAHIESLLLGARARDGEARPGDVPSLTGYPTWKHVVPLPTAALMATVGAPSIENFLVVGEAWASVIGAALARHRGAPGAGGTYRVLDMGCGCGRTARFLALRPDVRYVGFDIMAPLLEWCREAFREHGERFAFVHYDGYSAFYNPRGTIGPTEYRFPADDGTIDLAFAASLFTHLKPDDARHYLRETRRVLAPGGLALVSIHNEVCPETGVEGAEARIDVDTNRFVGWAADAGLTAVEHVGELCGQYALVFRAG
jgi:SAM-dependent methyltransferase